MKVLQKFVQLSLILVITLTTMGFRVNLEECGSHQEKQITFFGAPNCCCDENAQSSADPCPDITCLVQANFQSTANYRLVCEASVKIFKATPAYLVFTQTIRPVLQAKIPHFTLPPPVSGRYIGILHQTFII